MSDSCIVTIENSGRSFICERQLILDAAIAQGVELPYNCRGGACGTCKAEILEGAVDHGWVMGFAITDEEIAAGRCLTCSSRPTTQRLVLRMLNDVATAAPSRATVPAEYACEVLAAHNLTAFVRRIVVLLPTDAVFRFDAGMYVDVLLEGVEGARPYSMLTAASADGAAPGRMLSFLVARHAHGVASTRLHELVKVGSTLRIRGPYGTFRVPPQVSEPVLMIAGGTGLAPLLSMAEELLRNGHAGPLELLFSVRSAAEVFCLDELQGMAARYPRFCFRVFVTRDSLGPQWWERRRIPDYLAQTPPPTGVRTFVAGSPEFVEACATQLTRGGVSRNSIFTEAYTPHRQR